LGFRSIPRTPFKPRTPSPKIQNPICWVEHQQKGLEKHASFPPPLLLDPRLLCPPVDGLGFEVLGFEAGGMGFKESRNTLTNSDHTLKFQNAAFRFKGTHGACLLNPPLLPACHPSSARNRGWRPAHVHHTLRARGRIDTSLCLSYERSLPAYVRTKKSVFLSTVGSQ